MSYGLIGLGQKQLQSSMNGLAQASRNEAERAMKEEALERDYEAAESAKKGQMVGTGAAVGAAAGASMGASYGAMAGPYGALIGAGIGLIASELF